MAAESSLRQAAETQELQEPGARRGRFPGRSRSGAPSQCLVSRRRRQMSAVQAPASLRPRHSLLCPSAPGLPQLQSPLHQHAWWTWVHSTRLQTTCPTSVFGHHLCRAQHVAQDETAQSSQSFRETRTLSPPPCPEPAGLGTRRPSPMQWGFDRTELAFWSAVLGGMPHKGPHLSQGPQANPVCAQVPQASHWGKTGKGRIVLAWHLDGQRHMPTE